MIEWLNATPQSVKRPTFFSDSSGRPFSYSESESRSNDISLQLVEFSNVHSCDRSSNATLSNLAYKLYKNIARSRLFRRIAKMSIHLLMKLLLFKGLPQIYFTPQHNEKEFKQAISSKFGIVHEKLV